MGKLSLLALAISLVTNTHVLADNRAPAPSMPLSAEAAEWLDKVWSEEWAAKYGSPAITLNATAGVSVVLPAEALARAHAAGLGQREAVRAFLGRYGPRQCSDVIDLTVAHPELRVRLFPMNEAGPQFRRVAPVPADFSIDYSPGREVTCIRPSDLMS